MQSIALDCFQFIELHKKSNFVLKKTSCILRFEGGQKVSSRTMHSMHDEEKNSQDLRLTFNICIDE